MRELNRFADGGSFRDPSNKVFIVEGRVLRGLDAHSTNTFRELVRESFFSKLQERGLVVRSREVDPRKDVTAKAILDAGWTSVIEHERVPFVSYPYEWCFSMLRQAALLHLEILEHCVENGWTLKDASPYNVQWIGARPMFIDIGSFIRRKEGESWVGYRQFCSMMLTPLMLKKHAGIDPIPLLRSQLDGIEPIAASRYFKGAARFKKGVIPHVIFPAIVEASIAKRERDRAPARKRSGPSHSNAMFLGLVDSLRNVVDSLRSEVQHTDWSRYATSHSYNSGDFEAKKSFVARHVASRRWEHVWDIGCNTGTFSRIAAQHADYIVAVDGDHDSIEQLYQGEIAKKEYKILPVVMDLANPSPNQGWAGAERKAFDQRRKPDLVLCLALIHHIRVSANIPISMFVQWVRSLDASVIIEFVDRADEMFQKLIVNKSIDYPDYSLHEFEKVVAAQFTIIERQKLKGGCRELFFLSPS